MNQNVWGPHLWFFLHTLTFNYPFQPTDEKKQSTKAFFYDLQHMLPCSYCRGNYKRNLKETPIQLDSRKEMVYWLIDLHNEVNGQTGKKSMSYDQVIKLYEGAYQKALRLTENDRQINNVSTSLDKDFLLIVCSIVIMYGMYLYIY